MVEVKSRSEKAVGGDDNSLTALTASGCQAEMLKLSILTFYYFWGL